MQCKETQQRVKRSAGRSDDGGVELSGDEDFDIESRRVASFPPHDTSRYLMFTAEKTLWEQGFQFNARDTWQKN